MSLGRGPDSADLKLRAFVAAHLAVREVESVIEKAVDELIRAQKGLDEAGIASIEMRYGDAMTAFIQVRRGDAFWHREPTEPTPSALTS